MNHKDSLEKLLSFSNMLANEASKITMHYFRKKIQIENKSDNSPVTIADKKSELKVLAKSHTLH